MGDIPAILLAEDLGKDIIIITRAFQQVYVPHRLIVVHNGQEVTRYLVGHGKYADRQRFPFPSLLLLDLKLPGIDGFEVLAWLREVPALNHLPVIVLTASDHIHDVNKAYALGANSFLVKPSDFENTLQLAQTLTRHWLVDSRVASPCLTASPPPTVQPVIHPKPTRTRRRRLGP
jgi:CheY-like chemotaxis protein